LQNGKVTETMEIGDDGNFVIHTILDEGENDFVAITYVDGEEVSESETVTVILDTEAPDLTITSPKDGEQINRETATIEGIAEDEHLDIITVNGQETTLSDNGTFSERVLLTEGENIFEITATDLVGNKTTETLPIVADYTVPEISNLIPDTDMEIETGQSVKIAFESEPGLRTSFVVHMPLTNLGVQSVQATELPMMETTPGNYVGYYTVPRNTYAAGAVIEVKAVDDFGNEAREQAEGRL